MIKYPIKCLFNVLILNPNIILQIQLLYIVLSLVYPLSFCILIFHMIFYDLIKFVSNILLFTKKKKEINQ